MNSKIKNGLFIFLFAILLLPALQQHFPFIKSGPLLGKFEEVPDVKFSWPKWWDGSYREETNAFLNDRLGFRPDLVRANNQVDYTLFKRLHSMWLVPAKDQYLFQSFHVNSYYGKDFAGYNSIRERLIKFKAIQDTFSKRGKTMILAQAPNKGDFYPEHFADEFKSYEKEPTNYGAFLRIGDSLGIDEIDFNGWFISMKQQSEGLLFTRQGIHWSVYGSILAADSLVRYIERKRNIHMPRPVWAKVEHTTIAKDPDDDLGQTLNLIYPYTTEVYSYPEVSYPEEANMVKPRVIYIGDSFFETWIKYGFMDHTDSDWQVWNHFSKILDKDHRTLDRQNQLVEQTDWMGSIKSADCIVLMYTSFNLPVYGDGFIEKMYDYFYPKKG